MEAAPGVRPTQPASPASPGCNWSAPTTWWSPLPASTPSRAGRVAGGLGAEQGIEGRADRQLGGGLSRAVGAGAGVRQRAQQRDRHLVALDGSTVRAVG